MDRKFGVINVLGEECAPEDGSCIGGHIAAAGSNLHAAVKETKRLEKAGFRTQYELSLVRWADDNFQPWDTQVSAETRNVLDDLASENSQISTMGVLYRVGLAACTWVSGFLFS